MIRDGTVSVITGLYNGQRFIAETAKSIFQQQGIDVEWILIDDGSQDNGLRTSQQIVEQYASESVSVHFLKHEANQGIKPTYAEGVRIATGEFFKILDHDDVLSRSDSLLRQTTILDEHPTVGLVFSRTTLIDSEGSSIKEKRYPFVDGKPILDKPVLTANILFNWRLPFIHGSFMTRRSTFDELYLGKTPHFDTELLVDMLKSEKDIAYLDEPLFSYRIHEGNYSRTTEEALAEFYRGRRYIAQQLGLGRIPQEASVLYWKSMGVLGDLKTRVISSKERK